MQKMSKQQVILASQSPRRKELLSKMGLNFIVIPSNYDEHLDDSRSAAEVAEELALGKAMEIAKDHPDAIIIGSDTIVVINGKQLEKPRDEADAMYLLKMLSGQTNEIVTGVAVVQKSKAVALTDHDVVRVTFKPYNETAVKKYITSGDAMDKAGAYGIQSGAAPLIESMDGRYDTAIGLPTHLLSDFLKKIDVIAKPVELETPQFSNSL